MNLLRNEPAEFEGKWIAVVEYGSRVASICWRIQQTITNDDTEETAHALPALLEEVDSIENEFLAWKGHYEPPEDGLSGIFIWNMYRTTRAKLLQLVIKLLDHFEHLPTLITNFRSLEKRRFTCIITVQTMFQEILDSVPTALEVPESKPIDDALTHSRPLHWDDVTRCLASLKIIWFSDLALPQQKHLAYLGLQRCADELGMRHAMIMPPYVEMSTQAYNMNCTRDSCIIHNRDPSEPPGI